MDLSEWSILVGAASAFATAAAGFMALIAAKWTVDATKQAAAENSRLLKEQIEVQRTELAEARAAAVEVNRRDKLHAAYTLFKLAGSIEGIVRNAANNWTEQNKVTPRYPPDLIKRVEEAYPLQGFLNRDNHIGFQLLDALVHGEQLINKEHALNVSHRLNELRSALTPVIVGLPHGAGNRVYGSDGEQPLTAGADAVM
ncbi:hypothetical protein ACC699_17200 [Rhizobium ruizarguesonis]